MRPTKFGKVKMLKNQKKIKNRSMTLSVRRKKNSLQWFYKSDPACYRASPGTIATSAPSQGEAKPPAVRTAGFARFLNPFLAESAACATINPARRPAVG
jgi:hypothetical protein